MSSGESRSRSDPERDSLTGQALRWPSAGHDCIAARGLGRGAEDRAAVGSGADTERSKGRRELWEVRSGEPDVGQILEAPRTQRARSRLASTPAADQSASEVAQQTAKARERRTHEHHEPRHPSRMHDRETSPMCPVRAVTPLSPSANPASCLG